MAHYAVLDNNNIVVGVIVGKDEDDLDNLPEGYSDWADYHSKKFCNNATVLRTSYNTQNGVHLDGGTPFRGNFAGKGYVYLADKNVFVEPKPYDSWVLNETNWNYEPPISYPSDYATVEYNWSEAAYQADNTQGWVAV